MVGRELLHVAGLAIGAAMAASVAPARAADPGCPPAWPPRVPASASQSLSSDALLRLRDIGHPEPGIGGASPLAVSPDGRRVAFIVSEAVPEVNDTCETLLAIDLAAPSHVQVLDSGGRGIRLEEVLRGVRRPSGIPDLNLPAWSPDGRSLVYRKRTGSRTQVWRADLDGRPPSQLSHADHDVEAAGWSRDGARVLFAVRPGRAAAERAREAEAHRGYLYDARILPHLSPAPQLPAELPETVMALPRDGGAAVPASEADGAGFVRPAPLGTIDLGPVTGPDGSRAGTAPVDPTYFAERTLWAETPGGIRHVCARAACTGALRAVWWQDGEVMFLKRTGWRRETSVIQAWSPRTGRVRMVVVTQDWLGGCVGAAHAALCLTEGSRAPRRVIAIDPVSRARRLVFDPNPEIDTRRLPPVIRLKWRNSLGLAAWGDLVIPRGKRPAAGWPLVIVQYSSEGFLRGGTGDEYPIFPLAARGIAVLSFEVPDRVASLRQDITDPRALAAAGNRDWAERRSINDSLMRGLDRALARGDIDAGRIGITGLSDGSTTTRFALINNDRFAAAAISSCCLEPHSMMTLGGTAQADWFRSTGYPDASRSDPAFWLPASMAMNAARMDTPLLMQLADDEYIQALETFTALREHGKPVEMVVFPDEHHNKWQPLHRAAIYARNLDWFSFWLQDVVDPAPDKAEQYRRWQAMKAAPG